MTRSTDDSYQLSMRSAMCAVCPTFSADRSLASYHAFGRLCLRSPMGLGRNSRPRFCEACAARVHVPFCKAQAVRPLRFRVLR
jgi:hypothetical protein